MKPRTCRVCREKFTPAQPLQRVCSPACAISLARSSRARQEAKAHREAKAKAKTRAQWMKEAQQAVNAYVRARDSHLGCVSCDRPATWGGQWHASHLRSVGAASSLRFNLWNIHKSCSICNNWLSSNHAEYEPRLRAKIGNDKVDWLKSQNAPRTFSIEYLVRVKTIFRKKYRLLVKRGRVM
jgi:hypothetical protein